MIDRPPLFVEPLLWPAAKIYSGVMQARGLAYDRGWLESVDVGVPVLSIGNITAGGTGKTPLTSFLLQRFAERGRRVGVVSRGYGGREKGPARVPSDGKPSTAERFGDEPAWLAARHPSLPVVIGADRVAAARELSGQVDLILADDAFQHRRLKRGFDAVVIDATEPLWHYRSLPLGRQREDFHALARARAIFLTKTNLADEAALSWLRARLASAVPSVPVYEFEALLTGVAPLAAAVTETASASSLTGAVLLVSGIGRPMTFRKSVETDLGAVVREQMIFPDHHRYSEDDCRRISARAEELGVSAVVMTEKDAVKMSGLARALRPAVWVTRLESRPRTDFKEFYEAVDRFLF